MVYSVLDDECDEKKGKHTVQMSNISWKKPHTPFRPANNSIKGKKTWLLLALIFILVGAITFLSITTVIFSTMKERLDKSKKELQEFTNKFNEWKNTQGKSQVITICFNSENTPFMHPGFTL